MFKISFETRANEKKTVTSTINPKPNRRSDLQLRTAISAMQTFLFDPDARRYMIEVACQHISGLTESEQTICYVSDEQAKCLLSDVSAFEVLGHVSDNFDVPEGALKALLSNHSFFKQTQVFNLNIPNTLVPLLPSQSAVKAAFFVPVYINHELRALIVSVRCDTKYASVQLERIKPVIGSLMCSLRSAEVVAGRPTNFEENIRGNQFLKSLISTSPAAILVVDEEQSIIVSNQNAERLFAGMHNDQLYANLKRGLIGMPVENYLPHYRELFLWSQQEDKYATGEDVEVHAMFSDQQAFKTDGQETVVDITPFRYSNGLKTCTVLQIIENTHQHHLKELVENDHNHLLAIRHLIPIAVLKIDLNWRCTFANDRWLLDSGLTHEETLGYGWSSALIEQERKLLFNELKKCLNSGKDYRQDLQLMSPLGDVKWCELSAQIAVNEKQVVDSFLITLTDITSRINYQEKLRKVAEYDPLTGLVNRNLLFDRLQQAFYVAEREQTLVCVMFLDLDGFKLINDKLGHDSGDELLKQVATRLKKTLRKNDTIARFGGDEFVVLLGHDDHPTTISSVAEKLIAAVSQPFDLKDNNVINITTSVGIATGLASETTPNTLVKQADAALYLAKQQGKNQYELFDKKLNGEYKQRSFLASQLKRGINQGAFKFNYLPIARLNGKGLLGVDAILRFKDVNEQELLPEAFMPLLLQIGEMLAVVEWMLDETCKKLSIVGRDASVNDPFSISLSLPVNVLLLEELPSMIQKAANKAKVNPNNIVLKISETSLAKKHDELLAALINLKSSKAILLLDDFGLENASLTLISIGLFDRVAVCESLLNDVQQLNCKIVVSAITTLCGANNIDVIAKQSDCSAQKTQVLQELGFQYVQDQSRKVYRHFTQVINH